MNWKPLLWVGTSRVDIKRFPDAVRRRAGHELEEAIFVLHAFQKRSRRTSRLDIDLGAKRYREVVSNRSRS